MKKKLQAVATGMLALALVPAALAGCTGGSGSGGGSSQGADVPAGAAGSEQAESAEPEYATVGQEEGAAASCNLANKSGKAVTGLAVKATGAADYPAGLLAKGQQVDNGETVVVYWPDVEAAAAGSADASAGAVEAQSGPAAEGASSEAVASAEGAASEGSAAAADIALNTLADVQVTFSDGAVAELHQVALADLADATLRVSGGVAYLEYTSAQDGSAVSTLEAEKAIAQAAAEAKAQAEAEAKAQAEAQAKAQAEAEAAAAQQQYVDDGNVGGGNEESCVDDIVLNF